MTTNVKENISRGSSWMRGLFMLIFVLIYSIAELVLGAVVIFQFLFLVFGGEPNVRLQRFGRQVSTFIYQVFLYLTFNSDNRPFPFDNWPDLAEASRTAEAAGSVVAEPTEAQAEADEETSAKPAPTRKPRKPSAEETDAGGAGPH